MKPNLEFPTDEVASRPLQDNSYAVDGRTLKLRPGDQELPRVNDLPCVQDLVQRDIEARKRVGIQRYGTPLQPHNGRDVLRDAYEEALDLAMYLRQLMWERDNPLPAPNKETYRCGLGCPGEHPNVLEICQDDPVHVITVNQSTKPDARGLYEAQCSCGEYRSGPTSQNQAHKRGRAHMDASVGPTPPPNGWTCGPNCRSRGHGGPQDVCL